MRGYARDDGGAGAARTDSVGGEVREHPGGGAQVHYMHAALANGAVAGRGCVRKKFGMRIRAHQNEGVLGLKLHELGGGLRALRAATH